MKNMILITGNPADGFEYFGPVEANDPDVDSFIESELYNSDWWMVPLKPLNES